MDAPDLYGRGLAIGFAIAAAIGPIGLLCIRRTLEEGALVGLVSGLGAATADAAYASVAAFGLTVVSDGLIAGRRPLGVVGGLFLLFRAARAIRRPAASAPTEDRPPRGLVRAYATTVGLTITNPATILSFAAAFVGFGLAGHGGPAAVALVAGVLSGSAIWWVILAGAASAMRARLGPRAIGRLALASSALIAAMGLAAIGASLFTA